MSINIRAAIPQDAQAIAEIIQLAFGEEAKPEKIKRLIAQGNHFTYVAEAEKVIGFIDGFITISQDRTKRLELDLLAVHPDFTGQGIGKQLIRTFSENTQNIDEIRVLVAANNTPMHHAMKATDYQLDTQIQSLFLASKNNKDINCPLDAHLIPVETFTYSGIWLEGKISQEAIQAAQYERKKQGFDVVGAVIPSDNIQAITRVKEAGFEFIKDFQWWIAKSIQHRINIDL